MDTETIKLLIIGISPYIAGLFGFFISKHNIKRQQKFEVSRANFNSANELIVIFIQAHSDIRHALAYLKSWERTYYADTPNILRGLNLQISHTFTGAKEPIEYDSSKLSFIHPKKKERKSYKNIVGLNSISVMIDDYNKLQKNYASINSKHEQVIGNKPSTIEGDHIAVLLGPHCKPVVNSENDKITVSVVTVREHSEVLLSELEEFIENFPDVAESMIDKDILKSLGDVIRFDIKPFQTDQPN